MSSILYPAFEAALVGLIVSVIMIVFLPVFGFGETFTTKEIIILVIASAMTVVVDRAINLRK